MNFSSPDISQSFDKPPFVNKKKTMKMWNAIQFIMTSLIDPFFFFWNITIKIYQKLIIWILIIIVMVNKSLYRSIRVLVGEINDLQQKWLYITRPLFISFHDLKQYLLPNSRSSV